MGLGGSIDRFKNLNFIFKMPGHQGDITKYFSPKPKEEAKKGKINEEEAKKRKINEEEASCLSPEQKKRMLGNKMSAMIKVTSRRLPHVLHENIGTSWFPALQPEFEKPYFEKLNDFLNSERNSSVRIFPPHDQVWSWTHHFKIQDTKVVILGQDPYHGPSQAHGLCFSVQRPVPPPPSLKNMYKELEADIEGFAPAPKHGCLVGWAKQGVLMLNACLTVRQAQANSHKDKGWETLTTAVVKKVSDDCSDVVL